MGKKSVKRAEPSGAGTMGERNRDRLARARRLMAGAVPLGYDDDDNILRDVLADLMHLYPDFEVELAVARRNFEAEVTEEAQE